MFFQLDMECSWANYTLNETPAGSIAVMNSAVQKPTGKRTSIDGLAVLTNPNAVPIEGKLNVVFNTNIPGTDSNYWVLATDYENFSVVWNCQNLGNNRSAGEGWTEIV